MPSVQERRNSILEKSIEPKGRMLNDNGCGIDHLGTSVYARALANQINDVNTPVTFGIFARWGSGKSFLIKHIQSILRKQDKKNRQKPKSNSCISICKVLYKAVAFSVLLTILAVLLALVVVPKLFGIVEAEKITTTRIAVGCVIILLVILFALAFRKRLKFNKHGFSKILVLMYAKFTKLPILEPEQNIAGVKKEEHIHVKLAENETENKLDNSNEGKSIRYIFVDFNAWKYAGSDNLWAGIVLALAEAVEREFSSVTTRLFRGITLQKVAKSIFKSQPIYVKIHDTECTVINLAEQYGDVISCKKCKNVDPNNVEIWWSVRYSSNAQADLAVRMLERRFINTERKDPFNENNTSAKRKKMKKPGFWVHLKKYARKHCGFADLYWVLIFLILVLFIPITVFSFLDVKSDKSSDEASDAGVVFSKIIVLLPAGFTFIYVLVSNAHSMVKSQTNRLVTLLKGIEGNLANELGFMHKVKEEVEYITDLIHTVEFVYNVKYKVIIAIDDLDRIPLPKIRLVLESVNILLSDRSSPFVCLIAVDSRIAVESLEKPDRDNEQVPRISGHEYLKKIINIPFCLPEITRLDKKNYVAGLIDESDNTTKHNKKYHDKPNAQETNQAKKKNDRNCLDINYRDGEPFNSVSEESKTQCFEMKNLLPEASNSQVKNRDPMFKNKHGDSVEQINETEPILISYNNISQQRFSENQPESQGNALGIRNEIPKEFNDQTIGQSPLLSCLSIPIEEEEEFITIKAGSKPSTSTAYVPAMVPGLNESQIVETSATDDSKARLDSFLYNCRRHFLDDVLINHLEGNPRNIKRIFNVISLTALVLGCHQDKEEREKEISKIAKQSNPDLQQANPNTKSPYKKPKHNMDDDLARSIVTWVMLTDQWPYRSSYILQVIEDSDQRIDDKESFIADDTKLYEVFVKFVIPEISIEEKEILNLDGDPDIFRRFLQKQHLSKGRVKTLLKYTINLDQGLKNKVAINRSINYIKTKQYQHQESQSSNPEKKAFGGDFPSSLTTSSLDTSASLPVSPQKIPTGLVEVDTGAGAKSSKDQTRPAAEALGFVKG